MFQLGIISLQYLLSRNWSTICLKFVIGPGIRMDPELFRMSLKADNNTLKNCFFPLSSNSIRHSWKTGLGIMYSKKYFKREVKSKRKNYLILSKGSSLIYLNTATDAELSKKPFNISRIKVTFNKCFLNKFIPVHCIW